MTPTPKWYTLTERRALGRALRAGGWFTTLKALAKGDIGTVTRESKASVTLTPEGAVHDRLGLIASVTGSHLPKPKPGSVTFSMRVPDDERHAWQAQADAAKLTLAEWVRQACEHRLGK